MTTGPHPLTLAAELERLASLLRTSGPRAVELAGLLAARGWPTGGSGGGDQREVPDDERGVTLTSVEAAASSPGPWAGVDDRLSAQMEASWKASGPLLATLGQVLAHADPEATDRPNRQPGSGRCLACDRHVSGSASDRLRSGFCDACRKAWQRAGSPDRAWWIRRRREEMAPAAPVHVDPTVVGSAS